MNARTPGQTFNADCSASPPLLTGVLDFDVLAPLAIGVLLGTCVLVKRTQRRLSRGLVLAAMLAIACLAMGCINLFAPVTSRWRWDLAAFPPALILAHGFALFRLRNLKVTSPSASGWNEDDEALLRLKRSVVRHFGMVTLVLRYGVPAFFIAWFTIGMSNGLLRELGALFPHIAGAAECGARLPGIHWPAAATIGAAYGLVGAYAFVVLYLGYRSFRYDITPGAAMWCAATLATGPLLAGVFGMFWPPLPALATGEDSVRWFRVATFFIAGFSPRYAIDIIESIAKAGWKLAHKEEAQKPRAQPVTQLRGVTLEIAARLSEEGISTIFGMASADPVRLLRNTRYDKRHITGWIDAALVMDALPDDWEKLEKIGLCSATRLADFGRSAVEPSNEHPLTKLAAVAGVNELVLLTQAEGFATHPHVRLLELVDRLDFDSDGETEPRSEEEAGSPPSSTSASPATSR